METTKNVKPSKKTKSSSKNVTVDEPIKTPIVMEESSQPVETQPVETQQEIKLVDIQVTDENAALNIMVGFLNVAHKRGAFLIDESAKIWECIQKFQK
jgi:hypothetical protein